MSEILDGFRDESRKLGPTEVWLSSMAKAVAKLVREEGAIPASSVYMALGHNESDYRAVTEILRLGGLVSIAEHELRWIGP